MSGKVVHFEIPAEDTERAKSFYSQAFGWKIDSWGGDYMLVTTTPTGENGPTEPGGINGGMLPRQAPITAPVVTIEVEDMDTALQTVESLGASVVRGKQQVGEIGWAAYFVDPEGNTMGLWQGSGS